MNSHYSVYITKDAEEDIYQIFNYIARCDSFKNAEKILNKLENACYSLSDLPMRGRILPELKRISIFEYREIIVKPYRIIYEIDDESVFVFCILDSRRNLGELLEERLLR